MIGTEDLNRVLRRLKLSGVLQTLKGERYYDIVQMVVQTAISPAGLCAWVLCSHIIIGLFAAWLGCQRRSLA